MSKMKRVLALALAMILTFQLLPLQPVEVAAESSSVVDLSVTNIAATYVADASNIAWEYPVSTGADTAMGVHWDETNVYVGFTGLTAGESIAIAIANKQFSKTAEGYTDVMTIPFADIGIALSDYNMSTDFEVVAGGVLPNAKLHFALGMSLDVSSQLYYFPTHLNTGATTNVTYTAAGVYTIDNETVIDTAVSAAVDQTVAYFTGKTHTAAIDHVAYDLYAQQTVRVDAMPEVAYSYNGTGSAGGLVVCLIDRVNGNGLKCDTVAGTVVNEGGKLVMHFSATESVALGKTLGETFVLGMQWNKDGSADVYVDDVYMGSAAVATKTLAYNGNDNLNYYYNVLNQGDVKITVSDVCVWEGIPASAAAGINEDVLKTALQSANPAANLDLLEGDLVLPAFVAAPYLGNMAITWASSNEAVIANDGKVTAPAGANAEVTLTAKAGSKELAGVKVTVKTSGLVMTDEHYAIDMTTDISSVTWTYPVKFLTSGATPSGALNAYWDKDNLYIGVSYANAEMLTLTVNGKTLPAYTLATNGEEVITVAWEDVDTVISDYNQVVRVQAVLEDDGKTAQIADTAAYLHLALPVGSSIYNFPTHLNTSATKNVDYSTAAGVYVIDNETVIDATVSAAADQTAAYFTGKTLTAAIDHVAKDLLVLQTVCIDNMPAVTYAYNGTSSNGGLVISLIDRVNGNGLNCQTMSGTIVNESGMLVLHFNVDESVELGKRLGETFVLGIQWNKDETADVYVDGIYMGSCANVGKQLAYNGNDNLNYHYNDLAQGDVKITVTDVAVYEGIALTVADEIDVSALVGDLSSVVTDITLPTSFTTAYLGDVAITWESTNTDVISNTGKVTQPTDADAVVTLTAYAGTTKLGEVKATVKKNASASDDALAIPYSATQPATFDKVLTIMGQSAAVGNLGAAWNKDTLFLAVDYSGAANITITVGDYTVTEAVSGSGKVYAVPFAQTNIAELDYNKAVPVQVVLTDANGKEAKLADTTDKLYLAIPAGETVQNVGQGNFPSATYTPGFSFVSGALTVNQTAAADAVYYASSNNIPNSANVFDHVNKDIMLTQTFTVNSLPVSKPSQTTTGGGISGFYFYMNDRYDFKDNMLLGIIYNTGAGLKLYVNGADADIDLGVKVGDTFTLATQWNRNDTVDVYVNGILLQSVANGTTNMPQGQMGNHTMGYGYCNLAGNVNVAVTDVVLSAGIPASISCEITAENLIPGVDLSAVRSDLSLNTTFASAYLGDVNVTWSSSNTAVLENSGKIHRADGKDVTVQLSAVYNGNTAFTTDVTVKMNVPAQADKLAALYIADPSAITWNYTNGIIGTEGAPQGGVGAYWNKDNLVVGLEYGNATTATLHINGKTIEINLVNATSDTTGVSVKAAGSLATVTIPMSVLDVTVDYNVAIDFVATLTNASGSASSAEEGKGKLYFCLTPVTAVYNFPQYINNYAGGSLNVDYTTTEGVYVIDNETTIDAFTSIADASSNQAYLSGKTHTASINHLSYDLLAQQTICIEAMPETAYVSGNVGTNSTGGLVVYLIDRVENNGANCQTMYGTIVNEGGNLKLHIKDQKLDLGVKLGETFVLGMQWNRNDSVDVYVDGMYIATVADGTAALAYNGNDNLGYNYNQLDAGNVKITITDAAVWQGIPVSRKAEMTQEMILAGQDLSAVTGDIILPEVFTSQYLGDTALSWNSSNPEVITAAGKVTRPLTEDVTVTLTVSADGLGDLWSVEATVIGKSTKRSDLIKAFFTESGVSTVWNYTNGILGAENAPFGKLAAAWDSKYLYIALEQTDATEAVVHINGKDITVPLTAEKQVISLTWDEIGINVMYNKILDCYVELKNVNGSAASAAAEAGKLALLLRVDGYFNIGQKVNPAAVDGFGFDVTEGIIVLDTLDNANGAATVTAGAEKATLSTSWDKTFIDHSVNDLILEQTILVEAMPVTDPAFASTTTSNGLTFYMGYRVGGVYTDVDLLLGSIHNTADGLVLLIAKGDGTAETFKLNKQLGEAFVLATQWNKDDSVDVYVDNLFVTTVENATAKGMNGEANATVHYAYTNVQEDTRVIISGATVSNGLPMSIEDELTALNLMGVTSMAGVRNDIVLPTTYNSKYLGAVSPIVWTSSNEAVIDNSGKVTRPVDGNATVTLTASYLDQTVCSIDVEVVGVIATSADSIDAFHHNGELAVADRVFTAAALDAEGKAAAAVTASWDKDYLTLYFDMYTDAASVSVTIGGVTKTFTVPGAVFAEKIAISELLSWADFKYNMGLDVSVSVDSGAATFAGKLYLRIKPTNALYTFPWFINTYEGAIYNMDYTTTEGVYVFDTEKTIDSYTSVDTSSYGKMIFSGKGQDQLINHYKYDLLWQSTICIEAMPSATYKYNGTATGGLHMYMIDRVNGAYNDCKTMYATIINDGGSLKLHLAKTGVSIDLGKGLGDTFKMGLQWNMNDSVDVYVDGIYLQSVANVTVTEAGNGQDNITYAYNNLRDDVKLTITDVAVYEGIPASVEGELVATKVLASINTQSVMNDVTLPTAYESPYIGTISGISWKSADVTVITNDGLVSRPDGADKEVNMTAIFRGNEIFTQKFVVKAKAPVRDGVSAVNTAAASASSVSFKYTNGFAGAADAPTGSLGAAWTGTKLYVGAEYKNAEKLTVVIGDKSFEYALPSNSGTYAVEIALADVMDLNDLDYNASIPFYATLSNPVGTSATSNADNGKLYFTLPVSGAFNVGGKVNTSSTNNFYTNTQTGMIVFDNKTNGNGSSTITNASNPNAFSTGWDKNLIDHDINDLMLQQTFYIEALPKSTPGFIDEKGTTSARGLTFWIGDRGAGDWQDIRLALFGLHNTDDGLVLYVASGAAGAGYPSGTKVKLNRHVGEQFTLGTQWNMDNSVDVYVDGVFVKTVKDVTRAYVESQANSNVNYKFANLSGDTRIVITDATVSVGIPTSLKEEMAHEVILGQKVNTIRQDLAYSTVYTSPYMGEVPMTLVSSNPDVIDPATGNVVRDFDKDVKVTLTLKVRGETYWTENVTVKKAYEDQKNQVVAQHTFKPLAIGTGSFSGYEWNYTNGIIGENNAVYGNVAAQWDKDTIYLGLEYTGANNATVNVNGKTIVIDLINNAASLAGVKVAAKNGLAEILIPMETIGLKLYDYEKSVKMQLILSDGENTAQSASASKGTIRFTTSEVVSMYMDLGQAKPDLETAEGSATFTQFHTIPENFKLGDGKVVITADEETAGASMGTKYITNVDHNRNMKLYQTIRIDKMPQTVAKWNGNMVNNGYYFYVADRCIDPGVQSSHARMVYCEILHIGDGKLQLVVSGGVEEKYYAVDLPAKIGDTFELATLWEADDSFAVYVNGKKLAEWEDMTFIVSGYGMDLVMLGYKTLSKGTGKVTVSDIKLTYTPYTSIEQEVTAFSVFQDQIPVMVEDDIELPTKYNSIYLGELPLSWKSSNTEYMSNTGKVTRPTGIVNGVQVDLSMKMAGRSMFTVSPMIKSAATASLSLIDAAFTPEALTMDGHIYEEGWSMNTSLLSPGGKQPVNFGVQWDLQNLYLAVKAADLNKLNISLNGQKVSLGKGGITYTTGTSYTEIKIPFKTLGIDVKDYGIEIPVEMSYGDASYAGTIRLSSIDWISTDNMEHRSKHLFSTSDNIPNLGTAINENGFYLYDHYNDAEGAENFNSTKATNYIRFSKKFPGINTVIPVWPKDETYIMSFDFQAAAMPVYSGECIAPNIRAANYGFQFYIAGERSGPDGDAQADLVVGGIYNAGEQGLMLILSGEVSLDVIPLNRKVGDLMRIAIACEEDGDVTVLLDGEPIHFQENCEKRLSGMISYNEDAAVSFAVSRDQNAPKSEADNFDIYISNFALGTYYGEELLDSLTFDKFGGLNCNQFWDEEQELAGVTMDLKMIYEFSNKQLTNPVGLTWASSNPEIVNVETGKVNRPEKNGELVTVTVTTDTGRTKTFDMYVKGQNPDDTYLWTYRDIGAHQNPGEVLDVYTFILDESNNSLIYNQKESKPFNVVKLTDGDEFARLHTDFLELYVSDDNVTYTQIEDFKLLQIGCNWYLYDFQATGQYVKVHCTQLVGDEADFEALLQGIITVYQEDVFGQGEGTFATDTSVVVKNDTGLDARDEAWHINASDLGDIFLTENYADVRFYLNGKALYHYYENGDFVVRIPELAAGASVKLDVKAGNASSLDISNKEYVHEIIYGVRELWNPALYMGNRMARYFTFPSGTIICMDVRSDGNGMAKNFSYDGGLTWTKSEVVKETQGISTNMAGYIWDSHANRLWMNTHNTKAAGGTRIHLLYTEDEGVTWVHQVDENGVCGCPTSDCGSNYVDGIELCTNDGEGPGVDMILSTGGTFITETGARQGLEGMITYTTDGGKTWVEGDHFYVKEANTIRNGQSTENGFSESCLWETDDGTVVMYIRWQTTYMSHFGVFYSYDHGLTWTETPEYSEVYTVNTNPVSHRWKDLNLLVWSGNAAFGGDSYRRTPITIGIFDENDPKLKHLTVLQDVYLRSSLQSLDTATQQQATNPSIGTSVQSDTAFVEWFNNFNAVYTMNIRNFTDYMYKTKGAYDSFEGRTMKYEGWSQAYGTYYVSDEQASHGNRSLFVGAATVLGRSIGYMEQGTVSMDVYVNDPSMDMTLELQTGYSNDEMQRTSPVKVVFSGGKLDANGTVLELKQGWNTITLDVDLSESKADLVVNDTTASLVDVLLGQRTEILRDPLKEKPEEVTSDDIAFDGSIGKYISWVRLCPMQDIYMDNFLVVDNDPLMLPLGSDGSWEGDDSSDGNFFADYWWIFVIIALIAAAVVVVIISKKKGAAAAAAAGAAGAEAAPETPDTPNE